MYSIIRFFLFLLKPETAHHFTFSIIKFLFKLPFVSNLISNFYILNNKALECDVAGLKFPNPVGLAAGFDKDAKLFNELATFGFGSIEVGTLTPLAQDGNPKPRLFRLKKDRAIINRMGFNNQGVNKAVERLKVRRPGFILGGNIGKNKLTENDKAVTDYIKCFEALYEYVDYFVVNVSSPNTPNLRDLQEKEPLKNLLMELQKLNELKIKAKPIFLKIAPDLSEGQLDDIVEIVEQSGIAGVIATNTTISREGLLSAKELVENIGPGGLSGLPVKDKSTQVIRYIKNKSKGAFPIIAVGGIHSATDAIEKLEAGASLVQLYTGFIYEGPSLIKQINKAYLKSKYESAIK